MTSDRSVGRDEVIAILERLVAFDTESSRSNLDLIDYVEGYLRERGVASIRIPNAAGDKATLFATIGPTDRGGICLSGHTDVVPVAGQSWTSDPFTLRIADGKAYGRGAVDMKGFCALALAHVPLFQKSALKTPIHLIFSYDEETTCLGVEEPIARMGADLPRPRAVIVGEPTSMQPADAHKSVVTFNTYVHGFEAHSSKPELGASAIKGAVMLMSELDRIGEEMIARGEPTGRFDPPYTSVHIGRGAWRHGAQHHGEALQLLLGIPRACRASIPPRFRRASSAMRKRSCCPGLPLTASPRASRRSMRCRCRDFHPIPARSPRPWRSSSPGATARSPSPMAARPAISRERGSRPSFAALARSIRRTSPTNSSRSSKSMRVLPSCATSRNGARRTAEGETLVTAGSIFPCEGQVKPAK